MYSRKPYTNVNRWFNTIVNQPKVVKVIGKFEYCTKSAEFNQKIYSELTGSGDKKSQAKKEKVPKKAPAPTPKEEVVVEEPDAAELILAAEPKSNNPFDALPKGYAIL